MKQSTNTISNIVFVTTLTVVLITIISVLFPALIMSHVSPFQDNISIDIFELGAGFYSFFIVNSILLILGLLYFKKKLPNLIIKSFKTILAFEVSKKSTFVIMLILISAYIGFTAPELLESEFWGDFYLVENAAENWSFNGGAGILTNFRYFILHLSVNIFDNIRIIPFITSITLLILTYFITVKISQKRFSGLLAVMIVLQSTVFLTYDTTATYDNLWTVFYLVSIYTILKKWYLSPIAFMFAVSSKILTAAFLPMSLFFIYRSDIPNRDKIKALTSYGIILALFVAVFYLSDVDFLTTTEAGDVPVASPIKYYSGNFDYNLFWRGFTSFAFQLRFDGLVLTLLTPLIVGLYLTSRRGIVQADSIMIMIMGMLLVAPLLPALTTITVLSYRFIPIVVFFAIGVGTLLSKD